jgi:hypothetical protein
VVSQEIGSRDAHCSLAKRLILFLAKMKFGQKVRYPHLFPTVYFIGKYILVLDRDTFRLELDYRSIMHILVKVTSNQARTTFHGAVTSEGADSVAWDGGVSSMAGLGLRSDDASSRPR